LNLKYVSDAAAAELLGRRAFEGEKRKTCVMFRDTNSNFADAIRVETPGGHFVGWVLKGDSRAACEILDATTKALRKSKRALRKRSFAFHVTAVVEGDVEEGTAYLGDIQILIKNPVEVQLL
jgi:hypothetical protein